jgi:hypothetical protein
VPLDVAAGLVAVEVIAAAVTVVAVTAIIR